MKSNLLKNYIYNMSYQLLILIVPVITVPYVSRVLGTENIGLFNFFHSIVSYFVLFGCIGLNLYGQREIAFCKDNVRRRSRVFWELAIIRFVTVTISTIVYIALIVCNSTGYSHYYAIFLIELIAAAFDISWFFQGIEIFKTQAIRNFIVKFLGTAAIFAFVKTEQDLNIYIICFAATNLFGNLILWVQLPRYISRVPIHLFGITKHIIPVLIIFLPQIATSIYAQLDKVMVRLFSDYFQVSYYGQAEKIVKIVMTLVTSLGLVMLSRIATSFSQGNTAAIKEYIQKSFKFLFVIAYPSTFGLMAISYGMVPWFFGEGYDMVAPCMVCLSPIILLIGISNIIGTQFLLPTNRTKQYTLSVVCGLVVNVILNTVLISEFNKFGMGSLGAAVATVCAEATVTLVQFWFVRHEFKISIMLLGTKNLIASLIMGISVYWISTKLTVGVLNTIIEVGVGGVIYILILLLLKDRFIFETLKKFLGRKNEHDMHPKS